MDKKLVGLLEYLTESANNVIDWYHEGKLDGIQAKLNLVDIIREALTNLDGTAFEHVAWLRISLPDGVEDTKELCYLLASKAREVLSLRKLGPRAEGQSTVAYAALDMADITSTAKLVEILDKKGWSVRDWTYGCHRHAV